MASLIERIRRRYDRFAASIQVALDRLYLINILDRAVKEWKVTLPLVSLTLTLMASLAIWSQASKAGSYLHYALTALSTVALVLFVSRKITKAPASSRRINDAFYRRILFMCHVGDFQPTRASSDEDIWRIAGLEHEAFFIPSRKTLDQRVDRVGKWLREMDGLGQFIKLGDETIGYSVIIPVSERQAEIFTSGYATEWAFQVCRPEPLAPKITLYAQATFMKPRHHGAESSLGLAQAAVLNHLIDLSKRLSKLVFDEDTPEAINRLLQRTRILADEGSPRGGTFMTHLGFTQRGKTANGRKIWELDLSRHSALGTSTYQSRRLIAERLGLAPLAQEESGWKERWENFTAAIFGYTE